MLTIPYSIENEYYYCSFTLAAFPNEIFACCEDTQQKMEQGAKRLLDDLSISTDDRNLKFAEVKVPFETFIGNTDNFKADPT